MGALMNFVISPRGASCKMTDPKASRKLARQRPPVREMSLESRRAGASLLFFVSFLICIINLARASEQAGEQATTTKHQNDLWRDPAKPPEAAYTFPVDHLLELLETGDQLQENNRKSSPRAARSKRTRSLQNQNDLRSYLNLASQLDDMTMFALKQQKAKLGHPHWPGGSSRRRQQQRASLLEQPPGELMFSNRTGAVVHCGVAFELAQGVAEADKQQRRLEAEKQARGEQPSAGAPAGQGAAQTSRNFYSLPLVAGGAAGQASIQIRWEKESGEEVEPILYASDSTQAPSASPAADSNAPPDYDPQQPRRAASPATLRYVRAHDGALVFEPFRALDYQPDVHSSSYRCVASVIEPPPAANSAVGPGARASAVSRDMRVRAVVSQPPQPIKIDVVDELVVEGNSATFKCQIPAYASAFLQLADWTETGSGQSYTVQQTVGQLQASLARAPGQPGADWQQLASNLSSQRHFVHPKTGELTVINVDASLRGRSYRCRCKNKLTGELVSSANEGKLYVSESQSPMPPKVSSYAPAAGGNLAEAPALSSLLESGPLQKEPLVSLVQDEGELALLVCHLQASPRAQISWFKWTGEMQGHEQRAQLQPVSLDALTQMQQLLPNQSRAPFSDTGGGAPSTAPKYLQLANLLLIGQLTRNDSAHYSCLASNSLGVARFGTSLEVRHKLRARLSVSASAMELGKSLALECSVSGAPIHQVVFKHNRATIKSISGGAETTPEQARSHSAPDEAAEVDRFGSKRSFYAPAPHSPDGQPKMEEPAREQHSSNYFVLDDNEELEGDPPAPPQDDDETKAGPAAAASSRQLSHAVVIVLEPHHAGAYQCFAHNQFESSQSTAYIRVLDDPPRFKETFKSEIHQPGQDVSLHCSARANPLPEITWTIDDQPIPVVEALSNRVRFGDFVSRDNLVISYVNISQAQVADSGLYRCTADNRLARTSHEAHVSIAGEPLVKPMPNVTVLASTTFRQRCLVAGYPVGEIQWHHNGHRLPTNHRQRVHENGTLEVEHMEKSAGDEGEYTCLVVGQQRQRDGGLTTAEPASAGDSLKRLQSVAASAQGSLFVSIRVRPTIEPFAISRQLREGQRASIMCTISSGDLPITISWFRNDQLLLPVSSSQEAAVGVRGPGVAEWAPQQAAQSAAAAAAAGISAPSLSSSSQVAMVPASRGPHQQANYAHHQPIGEPAFWDGAGHSPNASSAPILASVRISRVSDYSSTLLFESLLSKHTANYTCLAHNDAGSVSHQAPMIVQVAPKWSIEPGDKSVVRGSSSSIDCMASGFPAPRVIWTKASGEAAALANNLSSNQQQPHKAGPTAAHQANQPTSQHLGVWRSIVSSPHLQVFENGSLNILDARDSDFGHYMCQASNGVGPGLSKVIRITINVAAQFQARHSIQYVARGEQTHLKCQARGDWPLALAWFSNRHKLEPINVRDNQSSALELVKAKPASGQQQQQQQALTLLSSTSANVLSVLGGSEALAANGSDSAGAWPTGNGISVELAGLHGQPGGAGLVLDRYTLSSAEYLLGPAAPPGRLADGGGQQEQTRGQFATGHSLPSLFQQPSQPVVVQHSSMLTVQRAERQDTGTFKCLTANNFGQDERTIQLIVQEPPEKIDELSVLEVGSRSISLGWRTPFDGNAPIQSYHIQYRLAPKSSPTGGPFSAGHHHRGNHHHSLSAATDQQEAASGLDSSMAWLNYSIAATAAAGEPRGAKAAAGQQSAAATAANTNRAALSGQLNKVTVAALKPVAHYWFRLEAENKLGRGPASSIIETRTLEEAPGAAPSKLTAAAKSSASILVSWNRLNEREVLGSVQGYYVGYKPLLGLAANDSAAETGEKSLSTLNGDSHKPSAPEAGGATQSTNIYKTIQHDDKLQKFDALLTGLKRSTKYMISVQAFNERGTGPASEPIVVKTLDLDPPRQLKLFVKQATNCSIQLEWRPLSQAALMAMLGSEAASKAGPAQDGGGGVADVVDYYSLYRAELNEQPRWQEIHLAGNAREHQVEDLKCGTRYQFYMMGANKIGLGDQSEILDTKTAGGLPIAPDRQSTFDVLNTTCYVVRLDHWQDNGCPIKQFNVRYRLESSRDWLQLAHFDMGVASAPPTGSKQLAAVSSGEEGRARRVNRRFARSPTDEATLFDTDRQEEDFAFIDYAAANAAAAGVDGELEEEANGRPLDYSALEAASLIAKGDELDPSEAAYRAEQAGSRPGLYSYLKESMPTFSARDLASAHDTPAGPKANKEGDTLAKAMPQKAQEWQAFNFVVESGKSAGRAGQADQQSEGWRRVHLCNLLENSFYVVQIRVENRVGETEAELRLLTSFEGLEYDNDIKRHVVGRLAGSNDPNDPNDRAMAHSATLNARLGFIAFGQWPVLMPVTIILTLVTVLIIIALLMKKSSSSGGNSSPDSSSSTTTSTTANTTMSSRANGTIASCPGGYLNDGSPRLAGPSSTVSDHASTTTTGAMFYGGNQPHANTMRHYSHGPRAKTDAMDESDLMLGAAAVDNYATVVAGPARHSATLFNHHAPATHYECRPQQPFQEDALANMLPTANEIHLANIYQQQRSANQIQQPPFGDPSATFNPAQLAHDEPSYGLAGMIGGLEPGLVVGHGQNSEQATITNHSTGSPSTSAMVSSSNNSGSTAGADDHHRFQHHHATLPAHASLHHNQQEASKGLNVYLCTAAKEEQAAKQQEAAIFYGLSPVSPQQPPTSLYGHQIQMRRFQQDDNDCRPSQLLEGAGGQANFAHHQHADCANHDRVVFDPDYATIRRTFPQAFKYLTLQHKTSQQLRDQIPNQHQQQNAQQMPDVNFVDTTTTT